MIRVNLCKSYIKFVNTVHIHIHTFLNLSSSPPPPFHPPSTLLLPAPLPSSPTLLPPSELNGFPVIVRWKAIAFSAPIASSCYMRIRFLSSLECYARWARFLPTVPFLFCLIAEFLGFVWCADLDCADTWYPFMFSADLFLKKKEKQFELCLMF